jgi:hypothetical protein
VAGFTIHSNRQSGDTPWFSPADINDQRHSFCDSNTGKGQRNESECEDTAISTRIEFAYAVLQDSGQSAGQEVYQCYRGVRVRRGARQGAADRRQCTTGTMLSRYGRVVYGSGDAHGAPYIEQKKGQKQCR